MKVLLLLGLVAVTLAEVMRFDGGRVYRLKPKTEDHVAIIKEIGDKLQVDFWRPSMAELVTVDSDVDVRVNAPHVGIFSNMLQQGDIDHELLIEDVQAAIEAQIDHNRTSTRAHDYEKYNTWDEIQGWIASIMSANPSLIRTYIIGHTYEGRPLTLMKIGKETNSTKPIIFMDCGIHAREWISPAFCQWFVKEAVSTYGSDSLMTQLLNEMDVFVLPVFNIDGYVYTWTANRMWRKTRSRQSGTPCIGVDPNRNFDARWCTVGASSDSCSETYCGCKPESEVEVRAVANVIRLNKFHIKLYLTIHSYSQLLLFPYSYTKKPAADHKKLLRVAKGAVKALSKTYGTPYTSGPGAKIIYLASGSSSDWAYDLGVKYSYTFELRDTGEYGFLLPKSQIKPTCQETMQAVKYIASQVLKKL